MWQGHKLLSIVNDTDSYLEVLRESDDYPEIDGVVQTSRYQEISPTAFQRAFTTAQKTP